jgi:ribosomal protein L3 glutamine methyltransferase
LRDWLRFAVSRFNHAGLAFGHGSANAYDEAAYLLLHTLHLPLDRLDPFLDARLTRTELKAVLEVIRRRAQDRVPAAYLTGEAWLGDYRFAVDERVIVPRSFIAELLFDRLQPWIADPERVARVLDLCTGSGALAIIAAEMFPNAKVDAVDISTDALEVARANVSNYGLSDRIRVIESDLYSELWRTRYDLVLTNPPYVNDASMAALPAEYRREPQVALAGGADGLDVVRRILADTSKHLKKNGLLIVEVGHERAHVEAAFPNLACTWLTTSAGDDMAFLLHASELPAA